MKRFYKFLSLFLFALIGMTNASAQDYKAGKLLTTPEEVVGKDVVLNIPLTSSDFGSAGYMNGPGKVSQVVTESCIYNFEPVEGEAEGHPLYLLKQKSTGLYLADDNITGETDHVDYTADKSKAFKMTVLVAELMNDENTDPKTRNSSFSGKHLGLTQTAFVLTRDQKFSEPQEGGNQYCYLGYFGVCFYSPYVDTNAWEIYELAKVQGEELLSNYLTRYQVDATNFPNDKTIPGYFQKAAYDKALAAYNAANEASTGTVSNEEAERLCKELKAAYEELLAARIPLSEGYYYINMPKSDRTMTTNTKVTNGKSEDLLWMKTGFQMPNPIDATAAAYIWKVTPVGKDSFTVQNFYNNQYISNKRSTNYKVPGDDAVAFLVQNESAILGIANKSNNNKSAFIFYANTQAWNTQFHAKHDNHGVMSWDDVDNANNQFVFNPVPQADIDKIKAEVAQQKLNEDLNAVYSQALSVYWSGIKVTGAPADEVFTDNGGLAVAYFSESKDANEGTLEALGDGNFDTYFHSNWHNGTFVPSLNKYHYVAVELSEALSKGLSVKMAKRLTNNDYPMQFAIYGTNEMAETDADTKWELLGFSNVTWDITNPNVTNEEQAAKAIGTAGITFEGSYKYFKFAATQTEYNIKDKRSNTRGYFALSELQVYPGTEDAENSTIKFVSAETRKNMETQLAGAKAELDAKKATQAQIDNLQAAYDKFVEELPVPSLLTDAIAAAKKAKNDAKNAGYIDEDGSKGVGYYSMDTVEAFDAAIEAAEAFDTNGKTAAEINAEVKKVKDATVAFQNGFTLPEVGKYYTLRGFSNKVNNYTSDESWQLTSYMAQVRSTGNSLEGGLMMTRPDGANTVESLKNDKNVVEINEELDAMLSDTIDATTHLSYLWYVEKAEAGKLTLRNVGTGMYFAPKAGAIGQSVEAAEISLSLVKPGGFALSLGKNENGAEQYLNALSSDGLTAWGDKGDANSHWFFKGLDADVATSSAYWPVAAEKYQILTLPFGVAAPSMGEEYGVAYKVVGVTEENKLVLAQYADENIEAGMPFIYKGGLATNLDASMFAEFEYADGEISAIDNVKFAFEAKEANGLVGQLCGSKKVGAGYAYLQNGNAVATSAEGTNIGANSGYIFVPDTADKVTEDAGTATIDLGKLVINSIEQNDVVVLPTTVNVYSLNGTLLRKNVKATNATQGLPAGIYVVGNQKVLVK